MANKRVRPLGVTISEYRSKVWWPNFYQRNRAKRIEAARIYQRTHSEWAQERNRRWKKRHPAQYAEYHARKQRMSYAVNRFVVIATYSPTVTCACCGWDRLFGPNRLEIDHINGAGKEHRAEIRKEWSNQLWKWIRGNDYPPIFRVLCKACNAIMQPGALKCVLHRREA